MSTINEKRVVEMQFNNASFESNAAKTLSTINKLKESLNFSGIGNTFNEVEQAANSVKFDHLMSAVDEIANKFTYFHQAVASQFNKLVDEAFAAGKNIVKAFTIEPITSGYEEYETKLGSIQTILSNTVSRNKEVSQQAIQEINDQATAAVEAQKTAQAEQKKNLQEAQKDQDKALQKSFQAQNKAYQKQAEAQTKALEKQTQAQLKAFDEQTEGQLESVEKLYDNQYKALEKEQEKEVTKQQEAYEKKYEALVKAQAQETALLDTTYEEQTKAYEKQVKEQSQVLEDRFDAETEALEKACDERYKTLEEKYDEQEDLLEKTYDEQMDTIEDYYDEQYEALEKSYEKEKKLLDKDHEDKLDMYHEEYLEKLKVADEDKYNAIKNIDNQIDSIKNLSKAEKEAQEEAEKRRKLYELELNVQNADTEYDKVKAEQRLASYRQELAEEQAEKERERQIEALEAQKDAIEEEYDLRKEQLEAEYEANKDAENELYDQKKENAEDLYKQQQKQLKDNEEKEKDALKDSLADQKKMLQQQKELEKEALDELTKQQKKALKKQQEAVKDALKEQQDLQKENLKEQYETQKENLNAQHTLQKKNLQEQNTTKLKQINEEYKAQFEALEKQRTKQLTNIKEARESQREALTEQIQAQKDALKDRQEQEQEALKERQDAQMDALNKRQEAELEALDKRHEQEMANIETEKEARIENLQKNAGKTEASSLEDVNKALDELNTYADKTIYNFSEMTRNIGTFTAAGVDLDTSVQAIKGISNLAALSGSNAQQASTAMYQLSQAIAGGTLKLEDWNSVQTAGMGGKIFQESLKETARVHGIEVDKMIAKEGSFEYSLQHGWLTNEILLETLAKFTGDMSRDQLKALGYTEEQIDGIVEIGQKAVEAATEVRTFSQLIDTTKEALGSGWTETFEIIFGNFEEATELWTGVSEIIGDVISKQADARNQLLTGWAEGGGRKKLLDSVSNLWQALLKIMEPIKAAFRDIFPPATSENLIKLTDKLKSFTASMSISTETSDKLRRVFNGVFSIVALLKNAFVAIGKVLSPFAPVVGAISDVFLTLAANLGDGISKFYEFTKSNDTFQTAISAIKGGIKLVSDALVEFIHFVMSPFEKLDEAAEGSAATVKKTFDEMGIPIEKSKNIIEKARDTIVEFYEKVKSYISEKFGKIDTSFLTDFYNTVKEKVGSTEGVFGKIGAAIKTFIDAIKSFGTSLVTNLTPLKDILGSFIATSGNFLAEKMSMLMDCLSKLPNPAKAAYEGIKKLRDLIAGWLKGDFKCPVGEVFTDLSIAVDQNVGPTRLKIQKFIEDMKTFIGELSAMSKPYLDKLKEFLEPLMNLEDLESFVAIGSFLSIAKSIKGIKNAFDDAGGAIADLIDNIGDAIDKVKATFGHINDFIDQSTNTVKTFQTSLKLNNFTRLSKVILTLAASVWILADAVKRLADIPKDDLIRGVAAISGLFVELSAATFLLTKFGGDAKISAMSVLALAGSMLIMQKAVQKFGQMDITQLTTGILSVMSLIAGLGLAMMAGSLGGMSFTQGAAIVALAGALLILYEAVKLFGKMDVDVMSQGLIVVGGIVAGLAYSMRFFNGFNFSAGAGIIAMATAMLILEKALKNFGQLDAPTIARGLVALGGSLAELAIGARAMVGTQSGASAMLSMSVATIALAAGMKIMASISFWDIVKALIGFAGAMVTLGAVAIVVSPFIPVVMQLASSIGVLAIGAAAVTAAIVALVYAIGKLAGQSPLDLAKAVLAFDAMVIAILESLRLFLPFIKDLLVDIVKVVCQVLVESTPVLVDAILEIAIAILDGIADRLPEILDLIFQMIIQILDGLNAYGPEIVRKALEFIMNILNELITVLRSSDLELGIDLTLIVFGIKRFVKGIGSIVPLLPKAALGIVGIAGLIAEVGAIIAAFGAISQIPHVTELIQKGGDLLQMIGTALGKFAGGFAGGFAAGFTAQLPMVAINLGMFMTNLQPFLEQVKLVTEEHKRGASRILSIVLALTAANIISAINNFLSLGTGYIILGGSLKEFGKKIKPFIEDTKDFKPGVATAIKYLAQAVLYITAANVLDGIMAFRKLFTGQKDPLGEFGEQIEAFGPHIKAFADSVKGLDTAAVVASASAAKILTEMAETVPNSGGLIAEFVGDNSLQTFGEELESFGPHLKSYAESIQGVRPATVRASANATKLLTDMANTVPNTGGLIAELLGDNNLASFGAQLEAFGPSLKAYAESIQDIDATKLEASTNAAKMLARMARLVPNTGGLAAQIFGDNDLASFGEDLKALGTAMADYSASVEGVKEGTVKASARGAMALAKLQANLPDMDGLYQKIFGQKESLTDFGSDIVAFGGKLKEYSDSVQGIDQTAVDASTSAGSMLAELAANLPEEEGFFKSLFGGGSDMGTFGSNIAAFGGYLYDYYVSIKDIVIADLTSVNTEAGNLVTLAKRVVKINHKTLKNVGSAISGLGTYLASFMGSISGAVNENLPTALANVQSIVDMCNNIVAINTDDLTAFDTALNELGYNGVTGFTEAFDTGTTDMETAVKDAIDAVITAINNKGTQIQTAAQTAAENIGTGFNTGIGNKTKSISDTVNAVVTGINSTFSTNITEEKYKGFGTNIMNGIKNGISGQGTVMINTIKLTCTGIYTAFKNNINMGNFNTFGKGIVGAIGVGIQTQTLDTQIIAACSSILKKFSSGISYENMKKIGSTAMNGLAYSMSFLTIENGNNIAKCAVLVRDIYGNRLSYNNFYNIGVNAMNGLTNGLTGSINNIINAASNVANAVINTVNRVFQIHSPSKVMIETGENLDQGLAKGISGKATIVKEAAHEMASDVTDDVTGQLGDMDSGLDTTQGTVDGVTDSVGELGGTAENTSENIDYLGDTASLTSEDIRDLRSQLKDVLTYLDQFNRSIKDGTTGLDDYGNEIFDTTQSLSDLGNLIDTITSKFDPLQMAVESLSNSFGTLGGSISSASTNLNGVGGSLGSYTGTGTTGSTDTDYDDLLKEYLGDSYTSGTSGKTGQTNDPNEVVIDEDKSSNSKNLKDIADSSKKTQKNSEKDDVIIIEAQEEVPDPGLTTVTLGTLDAANKLMDTTDTLQQMMSNFNNDTTVDLANESSNAFLKTKSLTVSQASGSGTDDSKLNETLTKLADVVPKLADSKVENNNTFNIQSTDPKAAANEVGIVLQRQVERRKAAWGM